MKQEIFLKDYTVPEYLIDSVDLTFQLKDDEKTAIKALYKVRKNPDSKKNNTFTLQANNIELQEIRLNDNVLSAKEYSFDGKVFTLENAPENFTFEVKNLIDPANNTALEGVYKSNGMFCSQCEAEGFRRITLHPDRPDVMSEFTTTIIANKKKYPILLSNGNKVDEEDLDDGLHMVKWHDPFKKPSYLFAIVAGDLDYIADTFTTMTRKEVKLKVFTDKQNINKAGFAMHSLKNAMKWDEEKFGREYDLEEFMIVAVDAFNMGAMENKGLNIFNSVAVLSSPKTSTDIQLEKIQAVVGHEYFHNWSGNRITCRDWFQLSLKEGLTVFRDSEFSKDMTEGVRKRIDDIRLLKSLQFAEDSSPMSHPVQPQSYQEIDNFYTLTVYEKGSEIVRMYKTLLGNEAFRRGVITYFNKHDGQAATIEDFRKCMEDEGGVDLSLFHRWYIQEGTPILKAEEHYNSKTQTLTLSFKQVLKEGQEPFFIPVKYGLVDKKGNDITSNMLIVREIDQSFEFYDLEEKPAVSLLRDFSAPVKLVHKQTDDEVLFLAKNDNDLFNRYEYSQKVIIKQVKQAVEDLKQGNTVTLNDDIIELYKTTLTDNTIGVPVLGAYLQMPKAIELNEFIQPIEPVFTAKALEEITKLLGQTLEPEFTALFNKYFKPNKSYEFSEFEVNRRRLETVCLSFLFAANEEKYLEVTQNLFENASNMTHEAAAFKLLISSENKTVRDSTINTFYEKWKQDNIVINTWFMEQAANNKIIDGTGFNKLLENTCFNIKEPNKSLFLVRGFIENPNFHSEQGYKAVADLIIKLDKINPHQTARLTKFMLDYKKYATPHAEQLLETLKYINANVKSAGVKEILERALK